MWHNRVAVWRQDIVGDWQPELCGSDLLLLGPSAGRFDARLTIRADGTWGWPYPPDRTLPPELPARFRWPWELAEDRVLSLWAPVPPMPQYEAHEWSREEKQWLVLAVTHLSLALADSHFTIVFRRLNREEHLRRKADEYGRLLASVQAWVRGGRAEPGDAAHRG